MPVKDLVSLSSDAIPKADIKVAFFDIDGTLLGLEGEYTQASRNEIARIQSAGIKTGIASGRPSFAAQFIADELSLADAGLFCTGAHMYSPRGGQTLGLCGLDKELSIHLTHYLRKSNVYYEIYTESDYFVESNKHSNIRATHAEHMRCDAMESDFEEVIGNHKIVKMLVAVDTKAAQKNLYEMEKAFPQCDFAYASIAKYPDWQFASIVDKKACKHKAFDTLLAHYQVEAENVISFGDAQSDMVFLQRAGIGVAMGNAKDNVKAIADFVTKPVWDEGVAYALSRLV